MIIMFNRYSTGFSLIESVVVLGIIGLLSGVMFANFHRTEQSAQLDFDADSFLGSLYEARALALAGQRVNGERPHGGYGVQISSCSTPPCSYVVFADTYPPAAVPPNPPVSPNETYEPGQDQLVATRTFSKQITVSSLTPSSPSTIVFSIPNGSVYINGAQADNELVVELRHATSDSIRRVRVNRATGQMNFE